MSAVKVSIRNGLEIIQSSKTPPAKPPGDELKFSQTNTSNESVDKIAVSNRAATTRKLIEKLAEMPDVRAERIEELRQKVSAGEYNPSSQEIADAILKAES